MRYENMELEERRTNIELKISSLLSYSFKVYFIESKAVVEKVDQLINELDEIFSNESKENIQMLLGGELNKDKIYLGSSIYEERCLIPLYFSLDLLIKSLEANFLNKVSNKDELIERLRNLQRLKEQSESLEFSSKFNPKDEFNKYTMERIIDSKGDFELGYDTKEGIKYLSVTTNWSHTPGYAKNGDYYMTGETTRGSSTPMTLYQKDEEAIKAVRLEKMKQKSALLEQIGIKYFKDGKIPMTHSFHYNLKDENLDRRLVMALFALSMKRDKMFFDDLLFGSVDYELKELEQIEKIVEEEQKIKEQEQKKNSSIESARKRYKDKNFLWRFFNRKLAPKNQDFDNMGIEEIDSLYVRRRG